MRIRVLIADEQAVARLGLRAVFDATDDIEVVGEVSDGESAVRRAAELRPDVVLIDVRHAGADGIATIRQLAALSSPAVPVLVVTMSDDTAHRPRGDDPEYLFESLRAGASGFLLMDSDPDSLTEAVRAVSDGRTVLVPAVTGKVVDAFVRLASATLTCRTVEGAPWDTGLSSREREVVALISSGRSNAEIARILRLSETTVKTHVSNVLAKWGLRDRVQLVVRAFKTGAVALDPQTDGPATRPRLGSDPGREPAVDG
ncbi:response regulator transcription factor [Nocardiopsis rhodophaea]|uniref:response regulator transcription factor n=1 Tax=Nocardiopsis rhodophaea TaxID=280238 RepID=UPI0031DBB1E6